MVLLCEPFSRWRWSGRVLDKDSAQLLPPALSVTCAESVVGCWRLGQCRDQTRIYYDYS